MKENVRKGGREEDRLMNEAVVINGFGIFCC
jgi:hypothetical protein